MLFFYDTEFTGLKKNTTLISIGVEAENGHTFYAESNEYAEKDPSVKENTWIQENVIKHLCVEENDDNLEHTRLVGSEQEIATALYDWVHCTLNHCDDKEKTNKALFVSDCAAYDSVLLFDLLTKGGEAIDLPDDIVPVVYDIVHDITKWVLIGDEPISFTEEDMQEAFDINREELLDNLMEAYIIYEYDYAPDDYDYDDEVVKYVTKKFKPSGEKHNALYDAKVIHSLYLLLNDED